MVQLRRRLDTCEQQMAALEACNPTDLLRVSRRSFQRDRVHATLMGPVDQANMKRIEKLLLGFSSRR